MRRRNSELNVVAHAREDRVRAGAHDEKQVSGRATVDAGVTLALQADALAVARARLDAKIDRLSACDRALAVAGGAGFGNAARAVAAGAVDVELHAAAHLRHLAGAMALGALHAAACGRLAVAGWAGLLAVNLDAGLAAANGGPEVDRSLVFEVGARLRPARLLPMLRAREHAGEDVFEAAPSRRSPRRRAGPERRPESRRSRSPRS